MESIYSETRNTLGKALINKNLKSFHAKQIFEWLYQKRVTSFDQMTNLSKTLRERLQQEYLIDKLDILETQVSKDGTTKFLFQLEDKNQVETVLMPQEYGNSICISSQVGCNMGCTFCASGEVKKIRDLSVAEMVLQVLQVQRYLDEKNDRISHIVVMGIGEPFDNFDNVVDFLYIVNDAFGLAIGARHITVSTCGLANKIRDFAHLPLQVNLALSLHAANDEKRKRIMPIANRYSLKETFDALAYYYEMTNRRITIEYVLLKDVNDTIDDANRLIELLKTKNVYVNLIPYNAVDENQYQSSNKVSIMKFYDQLKKNHIQCTIRKEFGSDISGACGQLRVQNMKEGVQE